MVLLSLGLSVSMMDVSFMILDDKIYVEINLFCVGSAKDLHENLKFDSQNNFENIF